ncbi:hypothetical protein [Brevibacillus porteri]|uniref:Uncharacterized protein n=1 Tax=Brevibacillus porteri TaxID=2126350 RepID=A0ABX5FUZ6_9BACL|nr:hypothetical protein [Brevibacillus porteri]MED1801345.1 hypothetical protein [Brevibacillus porteri]MED2135052.1 hypothetical protein [Brevibacillus porteri]MED2745149.1 hypothetical protein [Brevibacillus porteri]MED2813443.1 hypothetical protein [Brevibacillus porteri]MED2894766.1 hypothetical protein [Brevibacillus porteri]
MISDLNKLTCVEQLIEKLTKKELVHVSHIDLAEMDASLYEYINHLNDSIALFPTDYNSVISGVIRFKEGYFITLGMLFWKDSSRTEKFKEGTFLFYKRDSSNSIDDCVHITNSTETPELMDRLFYACCSNEKPEPLNKDSHLEHAIRYGQAYGEIKTILKNCLT